MKEDLQAKIEELYRHQMAQWDVARTNYAELSKVKFKRIAMGAHSVQVQWNPRRIISSAAKIDSASIQRRPCFLCSKNRPLEQEGIVYRDNYVILLNPYPVFRRHLTIASTSHTAQRIDGNFGIMLQLARDLKGFSVIYNGPSCGASAPDHFHFQSVPFDVLPINNDFINGDKALRISETKGLNIYTWTGHPTQAITFKSGKLHILRGAFARLYELLEEILPAPEEPMLNIITSYQAGEWIAHIFPRQKHRPRQYFADGEEKILLSPASIDMGGVLVMPREEDFNRISANDILDILNQVCVSQEFIRNLIPLIHNENA